MAKQHETTPRIGILWRGDRTVESPAPRPDRQLESLFDAFGKLPVTTVLIPFADDSVDDVREEVLSCDGVLVWVNPIQDGANRAHVDEILREASAVGVFVSARPDTIGKLGTKEVLFRTKELGWGSDTVLYLSSSEFAQRFPSRLASRRRLVVKQGRGNGGEGVWKVELIDENATDVQPDSIIRVQDARWRDGSSQTTPLAAFIARCEKYFAWSGCIVDQVFQDRLSDGMMRCYLSRNQVVGFCHQWPKGLLDFDPNEQPPLAEPTRTVMEGPDTPAYQRLRALAETEWVPQMQELLGIATESLPVIWDADFLYGPKTDAGADTYVLCEINVSAVWPFPPMASDTVANAALEGTVAARSTRGAGSGG
ncbi:MAG TPA: Cj0069 family protein [Acidimicrobiales bacterium]